MVVSCAAGVLIGVDAHSIFLRAILVIYCGNIISVLSLAPTLLNISDAELFTITLAASTVLLLLAVAVYFWWIVPFPNLIYNTLEIP